MRSLAVIIGVVTGLLSSPALANDRTAMNEELFRSMDKWSGFQLVSYRYDFQMSIKGCKYPEVRITISDSEVTAAKFMEDGKDCQSEKAFSKGEEVDLDAPHFQTTIAGIFAQIVNFHMNYMSFYSGSPPTSATYHPEYGFPTAFRVDAAMEDKLSYIPPESDYPRDFEFYISNFKAAQ